MIQVIYTWYRHIFHTITEILLNTELWIYTYFNICEKLLFFHIGQNCGEEQVKNDLEEMEGSEENED